MYGMVNRAIEDLVVSVAGEETWNRIRNEASIDQASFMDSQQYDDDVTFKLVESASKVLGQSPEDILHSFGRHWILYTGKEGWDTVFELAGDNMFDFINGLDSMHARVQVALPSASMPEFSVTEHDDYLELEYRSSRSGLAPMVMGLLDGLAEQFNENWNVEHIQDASSPGCDVFQLRQVFENSEDASEHAA